MKDSEKFSFKKRLKSFSFAFNGLKNLLQKEHNSRAHLIALIIVICLGFYFQIEPIEWMAVVIVSGFVIAAELLNTSIERLADVVEPKWNEKIGLIKDYCAAAVLISAITAVVVGGLVFVPKILELVRDIS